MWAFLKGMYLPMQCGAFLENNYIVYGAYCVSGETWKLKPELKYNMASKKEEIEVNIHKCEPCGKSFSHAHSLKNHIHTIHEGQKDHKCISCGKLFSQGGYLQKHIRTIHEGQRDYKCDSCGKSFSVARSLKRHIQTIHPN